MSIRPAEPRDGPRLRAFFATVPHHDAVFLKEDLDDDVVVEAWFTSGRVTRLVHVDADGVMAAVASLTPGFAHGVDENRAAMDAVGVEVGR